VLVYHRGSEADDLAAIAQLVEQEGVEVLHVLDCDMDDEVVATREDEDVQHLWQRRH